MSKSLGKLLLACLLVTSTAFAQGDIPELTAPVNDFAGVIDSSSKSSLDALIRKLQDATGDVIAVATVKTFKPYGDMQSYTLKMFEKHGMTNVAYWTFEDSPAKESTLIYVISHASREQAKKNWDEFRNDPEWKAVAAASEADGKIVEKVDSVFVDATDYSPLK